MNSVTRTVLLGLAVSLAACGDNSLVAPKTHAPAISLGTGAVGDRALDRPGRGSSGVLTPTDTERFDITIEPWHDTVYDLGAGNSIVFPAHSLCDPNGGSYGAGEWDKPCAPATASLTIGVKAWLDSNGESRIDFSEHVRFVPTNDRSGWVVVTFTPHPPRRSHGNVLLAPDPFFNILYCPTPTSKCFDESKKDPTLATVRDRSGKLTRRIKHFSGYVVSADDCGDQCISSTNSASSSQLAMLPSMFRGIRSNQISGWLRQGKADMLRRMTSLVYSGYMLASG